MRLLLALFVRPWGRVVLGVLILNLSIGLLIGKLPLPERSDLKRVAGTAHHATKTTRGRSDSGTWTLDIDGANATTVTVDLPDIITEKQVDSMIGRQIVALVKDGREHQDVWELSADGKPVMTYEQARQHQVETQQTLDAAAPYVAAAGVVALVTGIVGVVRRRRARKAAAA